MSAHQQQYQNRPRDDAMSANVLFLAPPLPLLKLLRSAWKTILAGGIVGVVLAGGYLAVSPPQYEARALISMAQIPVAGNASNGSVSTVTNIEDPVFLIVRLKVPSTYTPEAIAACGMGKAEMPAEEVAGLIRAILPRSVGSVILIKVRRESPQLAAQCVNGLFEMIRAQQAEKVKPMEDDLKGALADLEARQVRLEDGSVVGLNRGASVRVAFARGERRIVMAEGEASFDIVHDPNRPFLIDVAAQRVRVIGTEFNILNDGGRTTVTVRRGVVAVSGAGVADADVRVSEGQQLLHEAGAQEVHVRRVDANEAFAWRQGRLIYRDATLREVVRDLNRYFDRPVRVTDEDVAQFRFSGVLTVDSEERVLQRLKSFLPLDVAEDHDAVLLRRRRQ